MPEMLGSLEQQGFGIPLMKGKEKVYPIPLTVTLSAPSPATAISCFYHPVQQSWDTLVLFG